MGPGHAISCRPYIVLGDASLLTKYSSTKTRALTPAQASNNHDALHVPFFPKLEYLSVGMLDVNEQSVPIASEVYDMIATPLQRRKAYNVPLKTLNLARCGICTKHADALKELVQEFCWDGDEGESEADLDETQGP